MSLVPSNPAPGLVLSCREEDVYIVGGANSAGQAAIHFARCAKNVVMLVRGESLGATMSQYLIHDIEQTPNIRVEVGVQVVGVHGAEKPEAISIACARSGLVDRLPATSLFVFIGAAPRTEWLDGYIERDGRGFILTGPDLVRQGRRPSGWSVDRDPYLLEISMPGVSRWATSDTDPLSAWLPVLERAPSQSNSCTRT